jgi:hypothetical protein
MRTRVCRAARFRSASYMASLSTGVMSCVMQDTELRRCTFFTIEGRLQGCLNAQCSAAVTQLHSVMRTSFVDTQ